MKKVLIILTIIGLITIGFSNAKDTNKNTFLFDDDIDQSQTTYVEESVLPIGQIIDGEVIANVWVAQSFIPQKETLTRVFLYMGRNSSTNYSLNLSIRKYLSGDDLTNINVSADQIPTDIFDWVEFDFHDIPVRVNETYYIITHTENVSDNVYIWAANNQNISYPNGCAWISLDEGNSWGNESASLYSQFLHFNKPMPLQQNTWDMCFATFGKFDPPSVQITKPKDAIYLANEEFATFVEPVIIGKIIVEADAWDPSGIAKTEFYIDNILVDTVEEPPYKYYWVDWCFFKHFIRVVTYDTFGLQSELEIDVWKFF